MALTLTPAQERDLEAVLATVASIDASILERLRGDALLTGPPGWRHDLPRNLHDEFGAALGPVMRALEDRLERICEPELVPRHWSDPPVSAALPWCHLAFLVEAKAASIVGDGLLPEARLAFLRRPWRAVFGPEAQHAGDGAG
jgi:hypothetical protein